MCQAPFHSKYFKGITHLIFMTKSKESYYYYPHFTGEQTESQNVYMFIRDRVRIQIWAV